MADGGVHGMERSEWLQEICWRWGQMELRMDPVCSCGEGRVSEREEWGARPLNFGLEWPGGEWCHFLCFMSMYLESVEVVFLKQMTSLTKE